LQQNPASHFLTFHSRNTHFLPLFSTTDTTSVLRFRHGYQPWAIPPGRIRLRQAVVSLPDRRSG